MSGSGIPIVEDVGDFLENTASSVGDFVENTAGSTVDFVENTLESFDKEVLQQVNSITYIHHQQLLVEYLLQQIN